MTGFLKTLAPVTEAINQTMERLIAQDEELVGQVARYNFTGGGKRLRPLMFCLSSQTLGRELNEELFVFSTAFEFLHMATLLHDDIVDISETRRGRRATHLVFGVPEAVLAGDYLLAKAALLASSKSNTECGRIMIDIVGTMSLGELVQLKSRRRPDLSEAEYLKIIYRKTAVLLEGTAKVAAILAEAPVATVEKLTGYGRLVGLAFQIMDDVLDYQSDSATFGKPVGHDLDEGKITLPFILARRNLSVEQRERLDALAADSPLAPDAKRTIMDLVRAGGGVAEARARARSFIREALETLSGLEENKALNQLRELALYTVEREH